MKSCLAESDLQSLGNEMLENFERRAAAIPSELSALFHTEARQLETELLSIYKFAALSASKPDRVSARSCTPSTRHSVFARSGARLLMLNSTTNS